MEVYDGGGRQVFQRWWDTEDFRCVRGEDVHGDVERASRPAARSSHDQSRRVQRWLGRVAPLERRRRVVPGALVVWNHHDDDHDPDHHHADDDHDGAPTTTTTSTTTTTQAPPTTTTAPPSGRFDLLPPGAALPTSTQCASRVRRAPEVRQVNQRPNQFGDIPNQTRGVAGAWSDADPAKAPFTARVDGNFVGTTDEIIQWAACKWGVDEDYVRAQLVAESYWDQVNSLGDWGTSATSCEPRFPFGTGGRTGQCPESFGLGQTRFPYMRQRVPARL